MPRLTRPFLALSAPLLNGLGIGAGLLLCTGVIAPLWGLPAAIAASSGYGAVGVADTVTTPASKPAAMLPAVVGAVLVAGLVALTHGHAVAEATTVLLVTFSALLWTAWGKRGMPQSFVMILSLIFQMAAFREVPMDRSAALAHLAWVGVGAVGMGLWAELTAVVLAARYRTLALADSLQNLSELIRTQARWTRDRAEPDASATSQQDLLSLIRQQAALADVFQSARDLLYDRATEARDPRRRCEIDGLIHVVNLRDVVLACQLDIDQLPTSPSTRTALLRLAHFLTWHADRVAAMAHSVRFNAPMPAMAPAPRVLAPEDSRALQSLARRAAHLHDHCNALSAALQGQTPGPHPEAALLASLVSPATWSVAVLRRQLHLRAPTLRYALRATLAMACAVWLSHHLPWHSHPHWLLLTVAVVMRGSLEQTLARRDARVVGTLAGCALASALLWLPLGMPARFVLLALSMALAHAYVVRDYRITTTAAAVMALLQAKMFATGVHPVWLDAAERLADTLIGAALAWGFSYVLPSWERGQLPALIQRLQQALNRYAHHVLHWQEGAALAPERTHARREVYDAIWLLAQALQRTVREPAYAGSRTPHLEALLIRSHRLISQLAVVRIVLMHRQPDLHGPTATQAIAHTDRALHAWLAVAPDVAPPAPPRPAPGALDPQDDAVLVSHALPEPQGDPTPWLLRRLAQIEAEAAAWADAARGVARAG